MKNQCLAKEQKTTTYNPLFTKYQPKTQGNQSRFLWKSQGNQSSFQRKTQANQSRFLWETRVAQAMLLHLSIPQELLAGH